MNRISKYIVLDVRLASVLKAGTQAYLALENKWPNRGHRHPPGVLCPMEEAIQAVRDEYRRLDFEAALEASLDEDLPRC